MTSEDTLLSENELIAILDSEYGVLTEALDFDTARKYWNKVKQRLAEEGNHLRMEKDIKGMLPLIL